MASNADLIIRLRAEQQQLRKDLNQAKGRMKRFNSDVNQIGKQLKGTFMAAFGTAAVIGAIRSTTAAYNTQAQAIAQVEQGLKSTGNTVGFTTKELQKMAAELQKSTLFGDESILRDATAQLLTFTNITGNQFARTQQAALDLSTRIGGDLKSASIQLGKALNDPVANLSALSRSGIQFSMEQKAVIKSLAETNRLADAQTIILDELEKQYGGSAKAAAEVGTGSFTQLNNAIGDLMETIGALVAGNSASQGLVGLLIDATEKANEFIRTFQNVDLKEGLFALLAAPVTAGVSLKVISNLGKARAILKDLQEQGKFIKAPTNDLPTGFGIFEDSKNQSNFFDPERSFGKNVFANIKKNFRKQIAEAIVPAKKDINLALLGSIGDKETAEGLRPIVKQLYEPAISEAQMLANDLNAIVEGTLENALAAFVSGAATGGLKGAFQSLFAVIGAGLQTLGKALIAFGVSMKAFKAAFTNPVAAIIAGTAAIAAGAIVQQAASNLSSRATGGGGVPAGGTGSFQQFGPQRLQFAPVELVISGDKLRGTLKASDQNGSRLQG